MKMRHHNMGRGLVVLMMTMLTQWPSNTSTPHRVLAFRPVVASSPRRINPSKTSDDSLSAISMSADLSSSNVSENLANSSNAMSNMKTGINGAAAPQKSKLASLFSFDRLRGISNVASFLCVLDCTLLPIITVAFPLLGVINLGASQLEFLHQLGHQLALYFVLPVGGLTTAVNFWSHKKIRISSLALLGLSMIGLANSHLHHLPLVGHVEWMHTIQHGPWHRLVNILGCGFLLTSNYLSQQQGCAHDHDHGSCGHSHDHTHDHSH